MLRRFLAAVVVTGTAFAGAVGTAVPAGAAPCPGGEWPDYVEGKPPSASLGNSGLALWHDRWGWHLRVSEEGRDKAVFKGQISTDGAIGSTSYHLEPADAALVRGPHSLWYRFTNYGGVDGVNFGLRCASFVRISGTMDGAPIDTGDIYIGSGDTHPDANPFRIDREKPCPSGAWPDYAEGKPQSAALGSSGLALWHDRWGWHLRVREAGIDKAVFKGSISTDGFVRSARFYLEPDDAALSTGVHNVWYRFNNYGYVDGLNFVVRCASFVRISGTMDGAPIDTGDIYIGSGDTHPDTNPFRIDRVS